MHTESDCYKQTPKMTIKGVLWHSTGAKNKSLKRYVQPSTNDPNYDELIKLIGKNVYGNSWNRPNYDVAVHAFIGELADGTVAAVQTLPWDYKPWGCYYGRNGSCNNGWIQFEIEEWDLSDPVYFNKIYQEACELTAYLCTLYNLDPNGTVIMNGVNVPVILCHADSYKLGLGSNHGDVLHWFPKHGKTMDDVRKDVAALMGSSTVAPVNKVLYRVRKSWDDAKSQVGAFASIDNAKSVCDSSGAGYYVFDENGKVVYPIVESAPQLYRVRKSKDDAKSQKGAYANLDGAIKCCQDSGEGYHVFDKDYKIVYSYQAPVKEEKVVAVYDLDYPDKVKIVDFDKNFEEDELKRDCSKAIKGILANNNDFDIQIAKAFFELAPMYGINPMMAISQSVLETGWFKYQGSAVKPEQHNYCGLGVTSLGVEGNAFDTIENGVRAQLQHLYAYGCTNELPENEQTIVDKRFTYVKRGIAPYWQNLAGRWACPGYNTSVYKTPADAMDAGDTYGQKIRAICVKLCEIEVDEVDIEKYFPSNKPIVPDTSVDNMGTEYGSNDELEDNMNYVFKIIRKLCEAIIKFFKNHND
jgi:hypothetical protein